MKNMLMLCLFLGISFTFLSCRKDQSNIPDLTPTQVYLNNIQYMTLSVTNTDAAPSFLLHKTGRGNSSAACQISKDDLNVGGQEILCWLEAEELDLYFNGATMELEVPAGVCDYVKFKPYYYYQFAYGNTSYGASWLANGYSALYQPWITYSYSSCVSCTLNNFTLQSPFGSNGHCYNTDYTATDYDYSDIYEDGVNCDEGVVTSATLEFEPIASGSTTCENNLSALSEAEVAITKLGGKRGNCINGPGNEATDRTKYTNLPLPTYSSTINGSQTEFTFSSPAEKGHASNIYLANYVKNCAAGDYTYDVATVMDYVDTNTTEDITTDVWELRDPLKQSFPFYEWTCYNKAHEVKGIIRLQIREWDTHFTVADNIDKTDPSKMDVSGNEDLEYPEALNDIADWDDFISTGSPSCATSASSYGFDFPGINN